MFRLDLTENGCYLLRALPLGLHAGVTGRKINITDYTAPDTEIRMSDKKLVSSITGLPADRILMLDQVHGDTILHITGYPDGVRASEGYADGMITPLPELCLVIRTADCVPVFLYDPAKRVIGAVHSGWKGTMLDITGKCIGMMHNLYGSDPGNLLAFILPSIGPESYEVNSDVADHFPADTVRINGRLHVDLWGSIGRSCERNGLVQANIFNPRICNRKNTDEFFSHRFGDRGRNLNFIYMEQGSEPRTKQGREM